ncbi:MAG: helix-turn-helix domain-containing protein [Frankia sp.]|nr:helix-turn-helix domain-containing protein [Frankia sp.]
MTGATERESAGQVGETSPTMTAEELGRALADLRRQRGLSGEALGQMIGVSQAKISKIERGVLRPSPVDVKRIVVALDAPSELISELMAQANERPAAGGRSPAPARGVGNQQDFFVEEGRATLIRVFEPVAVPALMQISEYSRRLVNAFHTVESGDHRPHWAGTAATVSLRARRQERLYDTTKTFEFVLMESVLGNMYVTPGYMLAQVDRIEQVSRLENVTVRIVPLGAPLLLPPAHGFTLFDDELVLVESLDGAVRQDNARAEFYVSFFEAYAEIATADLAETLDRYKHHYAELAMPRPD